jgi:hypothetical protein
MANLFEMEQADYEKQWYEFSGEKNRLEDQRTTLETQLSEISIQIEHLEQMLDHLAPMAGITFGKNISGLGITDAIRVILKNSKERFAAQDVRRQLEDEGFDLSKYTSPMASIYKVLGRLVDDSQEVEREKEDYKVFFRWKQLPVAEISDDDIPF